MSDELVRQSKDGGIEVSVTISGTNHTRSLSDDLKVTEEHIQEVLIQAPGKTAHWNLLYQQQKSIKGRVKTSLESKHAELNLRFRKEANQDGVKISANEVEAKILCSPEYQELQNILLDEQEKENVLKACVDAIDELKSTLISLSANMRTLGDVKIKHLPKGGAAKVAEAVTEAKESLLAQRIKANRSK
jgi:hypothetical protein